VSFSGAYSQEALKTEGTHSAASDAGMENVCAMFLVRAVPTDVSLASEYQICVLCCADCSQIGVAYWVANNSEIRTGV
jgi:hypothetical protein